MPPRVSHGNPPYSNLLATQRIVASDPLTDHPVSWSRASQSCSPSPSWPIPIPGRALAGPVPWSQGWPVLVPLSQATTLVGGELAAHHESSLCVITYYVVICGGGRNMVWVLINLPFLFSESNYFDTNVRGMTASGNAVANTSVPVASSLKHKKYNAKSDTKPKRIVRYDANGMCPP